MLLQPPYPLRVLDVLHAFVFFSRILAFATKGSAYRHLILWDAAECAGRFTNLLRQSGGSRWCDHTTGTRRSLRKITFCNGQGERRRRTFESQAMFARRRTPKHDHRHCMVRAYCCCCQDCSNHCSTCKVCERAHPRTCVRRGRVHLMSGSGD